MTPIEAAQVIADAGVVEINIDTRGVITGVMRAETFTFEDGPPEPFRSFQPASTLDPRLREACEVYLRWRREQPVPPVEHGEWGPSPLRAIAPQLLRGPLLAMTPETSEDS